MSIRYKDTEYTYISAKVRGMENSLVGRDCLDRMISAEDTDAAAAYLREYGLDLAGLNASEREDVLVAALGEGISQIEKSAPVSAMFAFFRYPYDCSNIKSLIKCKIRNIPYESMMFSIGSVPVGVLAEHFEKNDFSCLPENMARAAGEAIEAYSKTKNPQKIDFILDRACFADIEACAKTFGIGIISEMTDMRADFTNFMICLRVLRMGMGAGFSEYLGEALVGSGKIGAKAFGDAAAVGEAELIDLLGRRGYKKLSSKLSVGCELSFAERLCDNERTELVKKAKYVTFGVEIPLAYIAALETEIQNIRIVLAGKDAKMSPEIISERIRECYV